MTVSPEMLDALDNYDPLVRRQALESLADEAFPPVSSPPVFNMHMHTFFSYNGEGWSPSRLAYEAKKAGFYAAGIVDFDVLDGVKEFYDAADLLQLRATAGFESRVFFKEYADHEINSPGEPGVFYFMGAGFKEQPPADSKPAEVFSAMLEQAHARNRALIERINVQLRGIALDYETDVLPLTPAGNATERHIVRAYFDKALAVADNDLIAAAELWADNLTMDAGELAELIQDTNGFVDFLRSKMMKKGGLGYVQPTEATFPPLDDVIKMILDCRAVPTTAWLDGASSGEADPMAQLECLVDKGVAAANIIPDRNWNFKDPVKAEKLIKEFHRYAGACAKLDLPVIVGTELNKPGQRLIDDFAAAPMKPLHKQFVFGTNVLVGHTRLFRFADFSLTGADAANEYPSRADRNQAFARVGALPAPAPEVLARLEGMHDGQAFSYLQDCARKKAWV